MTEIIKDINRAEARAKKEREAEEIEALVSRLIRELNLVTLVDTDEILYYRQGVYCFGAEAIIRAKLEEEIEGCNNHICEEALGTVRRRTYRKREEFDASPSILNLKNCLFDLEDCTVKPHDPRYLSLVQIPVTFNANAVCPKILQFLNEVLFAEDVPVIQECFGFLFWRDYPTSKAFMFIGEGSNGKSTMINLMKGLIGVQNASARSLQDLELNRFAKADLFSKLANLYSDLPDSALKSSGTFKMLTGGDLIEAEKKFQHPFRFVNYAKLIFSCNKIPEVHDDTTAFFRRWILITFPNTFEGDNENKNLLKQLTTESELSGLFNWAIEGLKRLRATGWKFSNSKSSEEIRDEYVRKSSPIRAFVLDCIEPNTQGRVEKQLLFEAFVSYCRDKHLPAVTSSTFFKNLVLHVQVTTVRLGRDEDSRRPWVFQGIILKTQGIKNREKGGLLGLPGLDNGKSNEMLGPGVPNEGSQSRESNESRDFPILMSPELARCQRTIGGVDYWSCKEHPDGWFTRDQWEAHCATYHASQ